MARWKAALAALIFLGSLGLAQGVLQAAPPLQDDLYIISYPGDNATVSGVVEIRGTVTHPNFNSYGVLYAPGPAPTGDSQWVIIVFGVEQQVTDGELALWDTSALGEDEQPAVPNGVYTLALARYRDGRTEPDLFYIRNITVNNEDITPTPAATDTPVPLPTAAPETPTPVQVEQPPTTTPRPTAAPQAGETPLAPSAEGTDEGDEEGGIPIDLGQLRSSFLRGVRVALLLFFVWGLYVLGKIGYRIFLRTRETGPPDRR